MSWDFLRMETSQSNNPNREQLQNVIESANIEGTSSLESYSAESENASYVTQIDVTTIISSSEPTIFKNTHFQTIETVHSADAKDVTNYYQKDEEKPSSSSLLNSTDTGGIDAGEISNRHSLYEHDTEPKSHNKDQEEGKNEEKETEESYEETEEDDEDDTTMSSEAVVDDIELILMPEMVQDLPPTDFSPQLVRVTEIKRIPAGTESDGDVFEDDVEYYDQESDFKKMDSEDEAIGESKIDGRLREIHSSSPGDDEDPNSEVFGLRNKPEKVISGKVNSGVQTDITALENISSLPYEFRRMSSGKSSSSTTTRLLGVPNKKLNWKSELTLLPSKTKITYDSMNDQDQYSPRVAKFTSQDTLDSSSQFMKPSTLYRTRNLSRNLNECDASESTFMLPMTGPIRNRISASTSTSNFRESTTAVHSYSAYHQISNSSMSRRQQSVLPTSTKNFRSSLPDLSSRVSTDNTGRRQTSNRHMKQKSVSGQKLHKKSSSDDDTSSLIDESERCLRSSIDLLLTDDLPSPGADFSCHSAGFGFRSSRGYYSSRRSYSQPILFDEGDSGDLQDSSIMGSPFLPRKLSDMRCSRWAKVILPNGQVAVVAVKEMDEVRDLISVNTDSGCMLTLPFRKVVFAWKIRR